MSSDTESQLQRLLVRLDRERRARLEAEMIAEKGLRELFMRQQELLLLEAIAEAANQAGSLADAMGLALDRICAFTGWPVGRLGLVEWPEHGTPTIRASGLSNPSLAGSLFAVRAVLDRTVATSLAGAAGAVAETGQASWIPDLRADETYAELSAVVPDEIRGVLAFPVLAGTEVAAVLEFVHTEEFELTDHLRGLMSQVGTQLGRIVERERARAHLIDAFHDPLTRLPNRAFFLRELGRALRRARHSSSSRFAVLFIDLDGFKVVNDSLGHGAGDELLVQIAHRLTESVRRRDSLRPPGRGEHAAVGPTVARIGGDEFTILVDRIPHAEAALGVARRVQQNLVAPFVVAGQELYAGASIGVAMSDALHLTPEDLLRDADVAMYRAKSLGKGRCELFDETMLRRATAQLQLETDIRHALGRQQLRLLFQPVVSLAHGRVVGMEALLRWEHPERGRLSPADFLHIAEDTGVILAFGDWAITEAVVHLRRWQQSLPDHERLTMAVNLSVRQLLDPDLLGSIRRAVRLADVPPGTLRLELTDANSSEHASELRDTVAALADLHVPVALDDFGTGQASMASLAHLPVQAIKLNRLFVGDLEPNTRTRVVARGVLALAHRLNVEVIAEGVESAGEADQLVALGCTLAQGYYFAPPVDAADVPAVLARIEARLEGGPDTDQATSA